MRPSRILIKVDLPAPFAPISPVTPGATVMVSPSSAVTFPGYTMVSALVSTTALLTASFTASTTASLAASLAGGGGSDRSAAARGLMDAQCQPPGAGTT